MAHSPSHSPSQAHPDHRASVEHPGPSPRLYVLVYLALMVLLVLTVSVAWLASGVIELVLTLSIAVVKALLVILYFMHIRYGSRLTWLFAAAGFAWLAILLVLIMSDYLSRSWLTG